MEIGRLVCVSFQKAFSKGLHKKLLKSVLREELKFCHVSETKENKQEMALKKVKYK